MAEGPLLVVLLHGYARSRRDMESLAGALRAAGHAPLSPNLPTTFGTREACLDALDRQIGDTVRARLAAGGDYALVGHSFGGLLARHWLAGGGPAPRALVTIASPHAGSELAELASRWPGLTRVLPPLQALRCGAQAPDFPAPRAFRIGAIAGNHAPGPAGRLLPGPNDGRVTVASALAGDADDCLLLPLDHQRIHHHPDTCSAVEHFLRTGRFPPRPVPAQ